MRDLDETSITDAVVARLSGATSARTREISEALIRHLHAFVREIEPTESEWERAIAFLTETGQRCDERRQEFVLLSDALGVSMLVDAINHRHPGEATETTVLGPFFVANAPLVASHTNIAGKLSGPPLLITGRILDFKGEPLGSATVDIWHADSDGLYDVQHDTGELGGRARVMTDERGEFQLWSVLPSPYPIPHDGPVGRMLAAQGRHPYRPAHVHFRVTAPGHARLVTHLFIRGSEFLDSDVVFGVKESLIRSVEECPGREAPEGGGARNSHYRLNAEIQLAQAAR